MVNGKKLRVGVIFGGRSAEHEVSLRSARNVVQALDPNRYEALLIGIDRAGCWHLNDSSRFMLESESPDLVHLSATDNSLALVPTSSGEVDLVSTERAASLGNLDVVFPVLHGPYGEDGTIQGLLKLAGVPFVGPSVLGSAVGMDKDVMKRLLRDAGIPIGDFITVEKRNRAALDFGRTVERLGLPVFVKPANLGSSVGISKATDRASFDAAVTEAFRYDRKILIEKFIEGREIEVAVLGNDSPIASVPGEVIPQGAHGFYSYEAKYLDDNGAALQIPARLPEEITTRVQAIAIQSFQALCCEGMSRVDMFVQSNGEILVNEINTIPGFTNISMYPKMLEASGIPYAELVDRLISLAIERFHEESALHISRES